MKKYIFKAYKKSYLKLYQQEERRLRKLLGNKALIEHIGSTAVPGLGGKGIIDIYVAVQKGRVAKYSKLVQKAGYEHKDSGGNDKRIFHQRDSGKAPNALVRYHLHLTFPENEDWQNAILSRDYLRKHPEEVRRYAQIKRKAAEESDQTKEKYMSIKQPVIEDILKKALAEI